MSDGENMKNLCSWTRLGVSRALLLLSGVLASGAVLAQNYYLDQGELKRSSRTITSLGPDLAGDKVDLYTGMVTITQTDVSIPGNSALPVAWGRRYQLSVRNNSGWDPEIPRIYGTFAGGGLITPTGWVVNGATTAAMQKRCTNFDAPPGVTSKRDDVVYAGGDSSSSDPETHAPGETGKTLVIRDPSKLTSYAEADSFWSGTRIYVPGEVDETILLRDPANTAAPSDGQSYPLVTKSHWQIRCLSSLAVGSGEGFIAVSPSGTQYKFDRMVFSRQVGGFSSNLVSGAKIEIWIMPSLVTDRHGNTVTYNYDPVNTSRVTSIVASDGRSLTITYATDSSYTVHDGARTWSYNAAGTQVTLPDGTYWQYSLSKPASPASSVLPCTTGTWQDGSFIPQPATHTIRHPSGTVTSLTMAWLVHGTSNFGGVGSCPDYGEGETRTFPIRSITSKSISGPGLTTATWTYTWGPHNASFYPCTGSCPTTKTLTVTDPLNVQTRYTFNNQWGSDGLLMRTDEGWNSSTSTAVKTTANTYAPSTVPTGNSLRNMGNNLLEHAIVPLKQRTMTQQGVDFTWLANTFDAKGRPASVTRSSSPGYSRTETTAYNDHTGKWVLGQIQSVTSGSLTPVLNDYHASTATLTSTSKFGVLQNSFTYNTDGTLASSTDGNAHTIYFSNYKRGLPQSVSYPNGSSESAVVDDLGLITSVTNAAGYTTGYGYADAMRRLTSITPPSGWTGTTLSFEPVSAIEYGLPAGHWRQTISKGNARTINYFDGLWRPVLTRTFDASDEASTRKVVVKHFDALGKVIAQSYPQRADVTSHANAVTGTHNTYDALGRIAQSQADSELGLLTTTNAYLTGFQTQTTNPRGKITTNSHWVLDNPADAQIAGIIAPAGVNVSIVRDAFGKPTSITRGGSAGGFTSSVTRSYVYDSGQRLCKTIEPEIGATVQAYDGAGNIAWRAPGVALTGTSSCDQASVASAAKISYAYSPLNQLTTTTYGDGSAGITRTYTPDGLLDTIASAGSTWTYGYNSLRLLATETLNYSSQNYGLSWGYNADGNKTSLTYPSGLTVSYNPNALDEPRQVSGYANSVSLHPNGAVAGYTLANGIVHSLTQNVRGLPLVNRDVGVMQDQYSYDGNGNVAGIADLQESVFGRTMAYDDLDRLTSTSAPGVWGTASYSYDTVDNLRTANVGSRTVTLNYTDGTNRLNSLTQNGSPVTYSYDPRGNITAKGLQTFGFDIGNRLSTSSLGGGYVYDGHGRRIRVASSDGSVRMQVYSQAGQLLWSTSTGGSRPTSTTAYIHLGGKQIAEVNSVSGTQYVHTDALSSPVAHTNTSGALMNRSRFEPYGYVAQGTKPGPATSLVGFTGHVQDPETDLVYMQQRYYDPIAGRFLSVDPVVTDANTGTGFGLYTYVDNNPYAKVDPDGREPQNKMWADPKGMTHAEAKAGDRAAGAVAVAGAGVAVVAMAMAPVAATVAAVAADTAATGSLAAGVLANAPAVNAAAITVAEVATGGIAGAVTVTGMTGHAVDQAINRGVKPAQILDAIKNPLKVMAPKADSLGRMSQKLVGEKASVVVNPDSGKVVTVHPTSTKTAEKLMESSK